MQFSHEGKVYDYQIYGEGEAVLLLHGFTGTKATWNTFVQNNGAGKQLITVDLPGHGRTRAASVASMEEVCRDLCLLMESLHHETFHLIGYSMGGRTALSIEMYYPEKVLSLILESASPGLKTAAEREERIKKDEKLAAFIEKEGITEFVDFWENLDMFASQKELPESLQEHIRKERLSHSKEGLAQSLRTVGTGVQPSWWRELDALIIPVLLIAGERDGKFVTINKEVQKQLKSGNLVICANAGHAVHVEKPQEFGKMVDGFFHTHT